MNIDEVSELLSQLPLPTAHFNPVGEVVFLNSAFTKLLGYKKVDIPTVEAHWSIFFPNVVYRKQVQREWVEMLEASAESGMPIEPMLLDIVAKNGEIKKLEVHSLQVGAFPVTMWVDFTEKVKAEEALDKLAHFDFLTGLPNRVLFFERLDYAIALSKRLDQKLAILFLDLDGFKIINDKLGHVAGDALLKAVATRLLKSIRKIDTVARFGGDEFAVILSYVEDEKTTVSVANKILAILSKPFIIDGEKCQISASIGISIPSENETDIHAIIKQADTAMYAVKNSGKNGFRFYIESM